MIKKSIKKQFSRDYTTASITDSMEQANMCFCKKVMGDGYKRWFKDCMNLIRGDHE